MSFSAEWNQVIWTSVTVLGISVTLLGGYLSNPHLVLAPGFAVLVAGVALELKHFVSAKRNQ